MKLIFITFLLCQNMNLIITITECEMILKDKCLGNTTIRFDFGIPLDESHLIKNFDNFTYDLCSEKCDKNVQCLMGAFNTKTYKCSLYDNNVYQGTESKEIQLYLWICCDTNSSYNAPYRCPGFWKLIQMSLTNNVHRSLDPLIEFNGLTKDECQDQCLNNNICGAANVLMIELPDADVVSCQLIIQYPVEDLHLVDTHEWNTYQWQCSHNYTPPKPPDTCTHRDNYPPGHWLIQNTSVYFNNESKQILFFYTLDYKTCLHNCEQYTDCKAAWYSPNSLYCILEAYSRSTCAEPTTSIHYNFTVYVWKTCDRIPSQKKNRDIENRDCRTLLSNEYVYIYPIECGQLLKTISKPYPCWTGINEAGRTTFSYSFHCQSNQSLTVIKSLERPFPKSLDLRNVTWFMVFTGYDSFWLINATYQSFRPTSYDNCKIFDASMKVSQSQRLHLIKRTQWFASKPSRQPIPFPINPVKYVIITDSERPFCNCFTIEACSYVLREQQLSMKPLFGSIHFSFVVTGDGVAYEGRGWDYGPTLSPTVPYHDFMSFALCGRYKHNPNLKSLISIKQLIDMSISLKKVSKDYILYIYNDIIDRPFPYEGLRRVIELWPHYRGYIKKDCCPITDTIIYMNIIFSISFLTIILAFIHMFHLKIYHNKICYIMRKCRIERIYGDLTIKTEQLHPPIELYQMRDLFLEEMHLSPFTTNIYWIEDNGVIFGRKEIVNKCKCRDEIFSYFDFCRLQSKPVDAGHITNLPCVTRCRTRICMYFAINAYSDIKCLFIQHYREERSVRRLHSYFQLAKCMCQSYRLTRYNTTLPHFGTINNTYKKIRNSRKNIVLTRDRIQERYTYLIENNNISRFYS